MAGRSCRRALAALAARPDARSRIEARMAGRSIAGCWRPSAARLTRDRGGHGGAFDRLPHDRRIEAHMAGRSIAGCWRGA